MNDENERSVASAGSVAGEPRNGAPSGCETVRCDQGPVAWAVMPRNSDYCVTLSTRREAAQKAAERKVEVGEYAAMDDIRIVPLYRSPTLTDAERTLICRLAAACEGGHPREWTNRALTADDRATLRGLLERMK